MTAKERIGVGLHRRRRLLIEEEGCSCRLLIEEEGCSCGNGLFSALEFDGLLLFQMLETQFEMLVVALGSLLRC